MPGGYIECWACLKLSVLLMRLAMSARLAIPRMQSNARLNSSVSWCSWSLALYQVRRKGPSIHNRRLRQLSPVPAGNPIVSQPIPHPRFDHPPAQVVFEVRMSDVEVLLEREVE